jgi:signal peptidase I
MLARLQSAVTSVVVVSFTLAALTLVSVLVLVPLASGGAALTVWTGSMEPEIPRGSVVVIRPVNPFRLAPGDVITYQVRPDDPTFVTHRVVEVQADVEPPSVITKGDANPGVDADPIEMRWIRGKVLMHVPYVGSMSELVRGSTGTMVLLLVFGGIALVLLGRTVVEELRKGGKQDDGSDDETSLWSIPAPPSPNGHAEDDERSVSASSLDRSG